MTSYTLVTGGAGFIGSHLVDRLLAAGEKDAGFSAQTDIGTGLSRLWASFSQDARG